MRNRPAGASLCSAIALVLLAPAAYGATRLVVIPVLAGGSPEPAAPMMSALADGLRQNPQWAVEHGDGLGSLGKAPAAPVSAETITTMTAEADAAAQSIVEGRAESAVAPLERMRKELIEANAKAARGAKGDDLLYRVSGLLVAALRGSPEADRAKTVASETVLLFPGRKPGASDAIPPDAAALLAEPPSAAPAKAGEKADAVKLTIQSRPEACEILVGSTVVGKAPVELLVQNGATYYLQGRCAGTTSAQPANASSGAAPAAVAAPLLSFQKRVSISGDEPRQEVVDAEFERTFGAEGLRRIRFASPAERRQLEESYARRVSERLDADLVVFASIGELSGSDWLSARLYLRSGYLNRQGFVRLEPQKANALGRFLATGKDVVGVLRPEEAATFVAPARPAGSPAPAFDPWYTDIPGWCFLGIGAVSFGLGLYANSVADRRQEDGDSIRGDTERQESLYRDAQSARFWGGIGTFGGAIMHLTGVVLLLIPEYRASEDELFVVAPRPFLGGGGFTLQGRF